MESKIPYSEYKDYVGTCVICGHNKFMWETQRPANLSMKYCQHCRDITMTTNIQEKS